MIEQKNMGTDQAASEEPAHKTTATSPDAITLALQQAILTLVAERGHGRTICPSEAARAVGGIHPDGWGPLMPHVRRISIMLAKDGQIVIIRKGKVADPDDFRGVYRLSIAPSEPTPDEA
jgi:hypothetical protein